MIENIREFFFLFKLFIRASIRGLLKLKKDNDKVYLECLEGKCAKCCKTFNLIYINNNELKSKKSDLMLKFLNKKAYIKGTHQGCSYLSNDGTCSIYDNRPNVCRSYPWYKIDGDIFYDSGCPGIKYCSDGKQKRRDDCLDDILNTTKIYKPVVKILKKLI
jgi:Fe-S-cluster containining protein